MPAGILHAEIAASNEPDVVERKLRQLPGDEQSAAMRLFLFVRLSGIVGLEEGV